MAAKMYVALALVTLSALWSSAGGCITPSPYVTYPNDTPAYVDYKKALYSMNQGLGNLCYSAQAVSDYYNFYQTNPSLYQGELNAKIAKFQQAQAYMEQMYQQYKQSSLNFHASMSGLGVSPLAMSYLPTPSDDVPTNTNGQLF